MTDKTPKQTDDERRYNEHLERISVVVDHLPPVIDALIRECPRVHPASFMGDIAHAGLRAMVGATLGMPDDPEVKECAMEIAAAAFDDACRAMMDAADAFEREGVDGIKRVHAEMVARSAARKSGSPEPAGEAQ